jgi:penicillin-binding protein 2
MFNRIFKKFKRRARFSGPVRKKNEDIDPEDIFLDATNLPGFDEHALEGRIEKPMGNATFTVLKVVFSLMIILLVSKLWVLGVKNGEVYAQISDNNRLEKVIIFANRGVIKDRNGLELAGNAIKDSDSDFAGRIYAPIKGLAHVIGYVKYPMKDRSGIYYEKEYRPQNGIERAYDQILKGQNGSKLTETDVLGRPISESVVDRPQEGETLMLSIDARVTEVLYNAIASLAQSSRFVGGTAVIMDVHTGEIIAMTSYPEYDQNLLTGGMDQKTFGELINNPAKPFLNRSVSGLYTPGSILKPIIALAALNEGIISPNKEIHSSGSLTVPNPYDPSKPSVFGDWKAHGWTAMREAIAVSSDVYFYTIGGGFGGQKGLGIGLIDKYLKMFEVDTPTGIELSGEVSGVIPTPEWKAVRFNGDIWRLGDTYITAIGQFGTQVTPLAAARFTAAIANKGKLLTPSFMLGGVPNPITSTLSFEEKDWRVVHEGMREAVNYGTAGWVNVPYVKAAAKTGTAEIGSAKAYVHSWSAGFFPYDNPKYAWVVLMERGPAKNTTGATSVMRAVLDWMSIYAPEYFH